MTIVSALSYNCRRFHEPPVIRGFQGLKACLSSARSYRVTRTLLCFAAVAGFALRCRGEQTSTVARKRKAGEVRAEDVRPEQRLGFDGHARILINRPDRVEVGSLIIRQPKLPLKTDVCALARLGFRRSCFLGTTDRDFAQRSGGSEFTQYACDHRATPCSGSRATPIFFSSRARAMARFWNSAKNFIS